MAINAFIIGFFTAMGWISAHQTVNALKHIEKPNTILEQQQ